MKGIFFIFYDDEMEEIPTFYNTVYLFYVLYICFCLCVLILYIYCSAYNLSLQL